MNPDIEQRKLYDSRLQAETRLLTNIELQALKHRHSIEGKGTDIYSLPWNTSTSTIGRRQAGNKQAQAGIHSGTAAPDTPFTEVCSKSLGLGKMALVTETRNQPVSWVEVRENK